MGILIQILGALSGIVDFFLNRQREQVGALKQQSGDDQATIKGAEHVQRIEEKVKGMSDSELDNFLNDSMR